MIDERHTEVSSKSEDLHSNSETHRFFEKRSVWVMLLAFVCMIFEIYTGLWSHSMALVMDGWHMGTHVLMFTLSFFAYRIVRKYEKSKNISLRPDDLITLSGFTSAVVLLITACIMAESALMRFFHPVTIHFTEALYVAVSGLVVNGISAIILHANYKRHDFSIRSSYLHVLSDLLTDFITILCLSLGLYFNINELDSLGGLLSSVIVGQWAIRLLIASGRQLVGFSRRDPNS